MSKRKKIVFFLNEEKESTPAYERINCFKRFFQREMPGFEVILVRDGYNLLKVLISSFRTDNYIFISMPQFRRWYVFIIPFVKVIFDIRDGWSIAIETGYGGLKKPNKSKAILARFIEKFAIYRASLTITCTPGLAKYFRKISKKNVINIPNGISKKKIDFIKALSLKYRYIKSDEELVFVCAGKFSEYGANKVKSVLHTISDRYGSNRCILRVIGADPSRNNWVYDYIKDCNLSISFEIEPRMEVENLYKQILNSDFGVVIIRDPLYDLGTKVYEYISASIPVLNYFDSPNNFTDYFRGAFDVEFSPKALFEREIVRENILSKHKDEILSKLV